MTIYKEPVRRKTVYRIKTNPRLGLAIMGDRSIFMNAPLGPPKARKIDAHCKLTIGFTELINSLNTKLPLTFYFS